MQGSAYLLPFYQGVVQGLSDAGALKETTRLAGLSGGALTSALFASGISGEAQFDAVNAMIKNCSAAGPSGCEPLNEKLGSLLATLLPEEAGEKVGGRVRVWVSALPNVTSPSLTGSVPFGVTDFTSTADLQEALFGSDMIPCFSDAKTFNLVRGVPAMDGGFSSDFRELCADAVSAGARCVTAATAVVNPARTQDKGKSLKGCKSAIQGDYKTSPSRAGVKGTAPLQPSTLPVSEWALPTACPADKAEVASVWPPFVAQGSTLEPEGAKPDIFAGARTDALSTWEACDWLAYALAPDFEKWRSVYEAGLAEAGAWAVEEGYCVEKGTQKAQKA